jgi:hypothetical protein
MNTVSENKKNETKTTASYDRFVASGAFLADDTSSTSQIGGTGSRRQLSVVIIIVIVVVVGHVDVGRLQERRA